MDQLLKFIEFNQYNLPAILQILTIYIVLMWLAVVVWTLRDITTRSSNLLVILSTTLFVAVGTVPALIIYLLIRPSQTLEDNRNKDLFYASVLDQRVSICEDCHGLVRTSFQYCPHCSNNLGKKCPNCNKKINPTWKYCPGCNEKLFVEPSFSLFFVRLIQASKQLRQISFKSFRAVFQKIGAILASIKLRKNIKKKNLRRAKFQVKRPTLSLPKFRLQIRFPNLQLPTIRKVKQSKPKVMAADKQAATKAVKAVAVNPKKRGRGRPAGKGDKKPRKKRADAGKKRGKYNREKPYRA